MGICASGEDQDELDRNAELEEELRQERLQMLFTFKILLLGAGEAGKSTIVKQLRLAHAKTPTAEELVLVADTLHQNTIDCLKSIINAAQKFEIEITDEKMQETADEILEFDESERIPPELGERIVEFYNGPICQAALKRRDEFWLLDSCQYYIDNLARFCEDDFTPSGEDTVQSRIRTTGIDVSNLEWKLPEPQEGEPDHLKLDVVDVGGQRNERKKWMHCFDDVKCILFIVNLAGYCQVLFEDLSQNRMTESLDILRQISSKDIFVDTPFYVFLNKTDLFEELIKKTPLSERFPEYKGGADLKLALAHVENEFKSVCPASKRDSIKCYTVIGVDHENIKANFLKVKLDLYQTNRPKIDAEKKKLADEANA